MSKRTHHLRDRNTMTTHIDKLEKALKDAEQENTNLRQFLMLAAYQVGRIRLDISEAEKIPKSAGFSVKQQGKFIQIDFHTNVGPKDQSQGKPSGVLAPGGGDDSDGEPADPDEQLH